MLATQKPNLILVIPNRDISYFAPLQGMFNKYFHSTKLQSQRPSMKSELALLAASAKTNLIATTDFATLKLINPHLEGTENDNIGTVLEFTSPTNVSVTLRIILLPSLVFNFSQNHGAFLIDHFLQKLVTKRFLKKDGFNWEFVLPSNVNSIAESSKGSFLCAVDIETTKEGLKITSVAYTFGFLSTSGIVSTKTYVIVCNKENYPFCIDAMRILNNTPTPKVMQNGQYDATYFLRFDAPLHNWLYDTYILAHCIFQELPKNLSFISSFYLDNYIYWKDESGRNLYEYNAKDTHNTFWVWLAMLGYAPQYAIENYKNKFHTTFPALSCGLDGLVVNPVTMGDHYAEEIIKKESAQKSLAQLIAIPTFNPGSPKQVLQLFHALGHTSATSSDAKETQKFKEQSPLYVRIADYITKYREAAKASGTYFQLDLLGGRLMFKLDQCGTDTGRLASQASNFWCGTQVQNMPEYARDMVEADHGWIFGAVDKAQAESYCTGYISEDTNLIHTVTTSPDFHCQNASMFFGIPFSELFSVATGKKLNKPIRDVAKRVNHGANYNMGWSVLWETMGTKEVLMAKKLLKLPPSMSIKSVCEYLLQCFDKAYPVIRGKWYTQIIAEVLRTGKLVTPTGYTRRTFLRPHKNKPDLNSCVAHKPQSLSSELVERAFVTIYHELQLKKYYGKFRLKAPIHDEIIFIATPDIIDEALEDVAQMMVIPITINNRLMTIPSTKGKGMKWSELKG